MTTYGYARVSSRDQNLDRQLSAFAEYGIAESNIYADKKSGKNFLRARYMQLKKKLKKGDLLIVAALDRLGRNYEQIIDEWEYITKRIGADIVVLDMPLLDTRARADTLIGKFVSDVVLQVLSFVAENERRNIRARQAEGIREYTNKFIATMQDYREKRIGLHDALLLLQLKKTAFYKHYAVLKERRQV